MAWRTSDEVELPDWCRDWRSTRQSSHRHKVVRDSVSTSGQNLFVSVDRDDRKLIFDEFNKDVFYSLKKRHRWEVLTLLTEHRWPNMRPVDNLQCTFSVKTRRNCRWSHREVQFKPEPGFTGWGYMGRFTNTAYDDGDELKMTITTQHPSMRTKHAPYKWKSSQRKHVEQYQELQDWDRNDVSGNVLWTSLGVHLPHQTSLAMASLRHYSSHSVQRPSTYPKSSRKFIYFRNVNDVKLQRNSQRAKRKALRQERKQSHWGLEEWTRELAESNESGKQKLDKVQSKQPRRSLPARRPSRRQGAANSYTLHFIPIRIYASETNPSQLKKLYRHMYWEGRAWPRRFLLDLSALEHGGGLQALHFLVFISREATGNGSTRLPRLNSANRVSKTQIANEPYFMTFSSELEIDWRKAFPPMCNYHLREVVDTISRLMALARPLRPQTGVDLHIPLTELTIPSTSSSFLRSTVHSIPTDSPSTVRTFYKEHPEWQYSGSQTAFLYSSNGSTSQSLDQQCTKCGVPFESPPQHSRCNFLRYRCGHTRCNGCWSAHVMHCVWRGHTTVRCVEPLCSEVLDCVLVLSYLPVVLYKLHLLRLTQAALSRLTTERRLQQQEHLQARLVWCPNPSCRQALLVSRPKNEDKIPVYLRCSCDHTFCLRCGHTPHWPLPCPDPPHPIFTSHSCPQCEHQFPRGGYWPCLLCPNCEHCFCATCKLPASGAHFIGCGVENWNNDRRISTAVTNKVQHWAVPDWVLQEVRASKQRRTGADLQKLQATYFVGAYKEAFKLGRVDYSSLEKEAQRCARLYGRASMLLERLFYRFVESAHPPERKLPCASHLSPQNRTLLHWAFVLRFYLLRVYDLGVTGTARPANLSLRREERLRCLQEFVRFCDNIPLL